MLKNTFTFIIAILLFSQLQAQDCVTINEPTVLCIGADETLSATFTTGTDAAVTYNWSISSPIGGGTATLTDANTATPTITYAEAGFIDISLVTAGTCVDTKTIRRFIGSSSFIQLPNNDDGFLTLCAGETISLQALNAGNGTQSEAWSQAGDGMVTFSTTAGPSTDITTTHPGSVTITHTYTDNNSCVAISSRVFTIYAEVAAAIGNGTEAAVCTDGNLQLLGMPSGGPGTFTHQWTLVDASNPFLTINDLDDPTLQNPTLTASNNAVEGDTYTFNYTATPTGDDCNPATSLNIIVTVRKNALEAELSHSGDNLSCTASSDVILNVNISLPVGDLTSRTYTIELSDGTIVENYTDDDDIIVNPTETTTYTLVSVNDELGCPVLELIGSETIIVDVIAPVINNCPVNPEVDADATCSGVIPDYATSLDITDDCPVSRVQTPEAGTSFSATAHNTTQEVSIIVTDENNNSSTCTFTTTLKDKTGPNITTCPDNRPIDTNQGTCEGTVPDLVAEVMATDNCGGMVSIAQSPDANTFFGTAHGSTQDITFTVTDVVGNSSTCMTTLTLVDNQAPVFNIDVPTAMTINTGSDNCSGIVPNFEIQDLASDNCTVTITQDPDEDSTFGGMHGAEQVVTLTATDGISSVNHTITLTLNDNVNPTVDCSNQSQTVTTDVGVCEALVTIPVPPTNDNCMVNSTSNNFNNSGDASGTYPLGTTTVIWTVTDDAGLVGTCSFTVTVNDETAPTLTCADLTANTDLDECTTVFTDNTNTIDGDNCEAIEDLMISYEISGTTPRTGNGLLNNITLNLGTTNVTYTVTDMSNNTQTCDFTVIISDVQDPAFTQTPAPEQNFSTNTNDCDSVIPDLTGQATATDNCDTDVAITQDPVQGSVYSEPVGSVVTVTITATDNSGNTSATDVILTLVDDVNPTITCPANVTVDTDPSATACEASATVAAPMTDDNCMVTSFNNDFNNTDNATDIYPGGTTTVVWTVVDASDNMNTCEMTVTVNDATAPVLTCTDLTANTDPNICTTAFTDATNTIDSDNCDIVDDLNISYELSGETMGTGNGTLNNTTLNLGVTNVTYTATDQNSNSAMCQFTVTVSDAQIPVFTEVPANQNFSTNNDDCDGIIPDLTGQTTATDNCDTEVAITQDPTPGSTYAGAVGTIATVTITATDNDGNNDTRTVDLTLVDDVNPTIICPANVTVDTDPSATACEASATVAAPMTDDNCMVASFSNDFNNSINASDTYPAGITTTVVWTITDASNNMATCNMTVTVNDATAPVLTCTDLTANTDPDVCTTAFTDATNTIDSDNCDIVDDLNISYELSGETMGTGNGTLNNTTLNIGTTTVTYSATDKSNNTGTCTFDVVISDAQVPVITQVPLDQNFSTNTEDCNGLIPDLRGQTTATDNCTGVTISQDPVEGSVYEGAVGSTVTINMIATDDTGNESDMAPVLLTFVDDVVPTITCPADITVDTDPSATTCEASATVAAPMTDDNCMVASFSNDFNNSINASDTYPAGITTVVWTVTDASNNMATCSMTVTVNDATNPTIVCEDIMVGTDNDRCGVIYTDNATLIDDNCEVNAISYSYPDGSGILGNGTTTTNGRVENLELEIGELEITYHVEDISGNESQCVFVITVLDDDAPIFVAPPLERIINTGNDNCSGIVPNFVNELDITDNCPDNLMVSQEPSSGSNFGAADGDVQIVTITAIDGVNTSTHEVLLRLEDAVVPTITCEDVSTNANPITCSANVTVPIPTTGDNCDGVSLTNDYTNTDNASFVYPVGTTEVLWTVTDAAGNTAPCTSNITVTDNINPTVDCPDDVTTTVIGTCTATYTDMVSSLNDNCSAVAVAYVLTGDTNGDGTGKLNNTTLNKGTTNVEYTVSDNTNNSVVCTFNVTVNDEENPTLTQVPADQNFPTNANDCNAVVPNLVDGSTASDNCPNVVITQDPVEGTPFDGSESNTLEVMIIATDDSGNTATELVTLTLVDTTNPMISCPSNITTTTDAGECFATVTVPQATVTDNCGADLETLNNDFNNTDNASGEYPTGTTTVNWTVSDFTGNSAACSMTVTVADEEDPTVLCEDITVSTDPDICGVIYTDAITVIEDNCTLASISYTYPNGNLFPPFTTTATGRIENFELEVETLEFTYEVEDAAGRTTTCVFEVTVVDDIGPVISGPTDDVFVPTNSGTCEGTVPDLLVGGDYMATENCDNTSGLSQDPAPNSTFTGLQVITISATDDAGNTGTLEVNIIVEDTQIPTITCPADVTADTDADECAAVVTVPAPTTDDNCAVGSISNNFNDTDDASGTYTLGTTIVEWTVIDAAGNEASCMMNVIVEDGQAPNFTTIPEDRTIEANLNTCMATIPNLANEAMADDNCGNVIITQSPAEGAMFGGSHGATETVMITAVDGGSNATTIMVTLTVSDTQVPTITDCAPSQTVNPEANCTPSIPDLTGLVDFDDNCGATASQFPAANTTFEDSQLVTITITDDNGNTANCTTTIFAFDDEAPVISGCDNLVKNVNVSTTLKSDACIVEVPDFTADLTTTDNCDMDISFSQNPAAGTIINNQNGLVVSVSVSASDDNSNTSTCSATLNIVDDVAPLFRACPMSTKVVADNGSATVTWVRPVVTDECDTEVMVSLNTQGVTVNEDGNTVSGDFPVGTTTVTYTGTDDASNVEVCSFRVVVE